MISIIRRSAAKTLAGAVDMRMNRNNRNALALFGLLLIVSIATLHITYASPLSAPLPPASHFSTKPLFMYLIDVSGWYEITPNERAVASPFDLAIDATGSLPLQIGHWQSEPYPLGNEVNEWFENPDLALSSIYCDDLGHQVWFSIFGSRGSKSYFLFEHTPITSYPAAGWTVLESGIAPISINEKAIYTQKTTLALKGERRLLLVPLVELRS
jgi:hypothetical protein